MRIEDLRVVDMAGGIAGGYCAKLLADAGADVVTVESPEGAPERAGTPGLFDFLHTSVRSVSPETGHRLARGAQVVLTGSPVAEPEAAAARSSRRVLVAITPFGSSGPWVGRPATEFTLQAACGSTGGRGLPGLPPLAAGGRLGEWQAGIYAGVGALAACWRLARGGPGALVDVAVLDCMAVGMVTFPSVFAEFAAATGHRPMVAAARRIEVPSIEPTADGFVNFTTNSAQQFADFAALIGHPELPEDPRFAAAGARFQHREEFWAMTRAYTTARSSATVLEEAGLLRIPVGPVLDGSSTLTFEHFVERGVFVANPTGRFCQPRRPYRLAGREAPPLRPVPRPAEHDGTVEWPRRADGADGADGPVAGEADLAADGAELPLAGIRVIDLTAWWAGPSATNALGCLGADVVKVESTVRPDLMRFASAQDPTAPQWWEWGPLAHAANTNKRGVTVDLARPEGRDLAMRLFETADLVVENYTPRVMDQFGFTWERLHRANPRLSVVRMPAFGLDGPWRDRPGFAQTMEALTGLAAATGWPDASPVLVGGAGDPIAGLHASFAALVALFACATAGQGCLVEATMVEAVLNAAAGATIAYQLTGVAPGRAGNRSQTGSAPQGVYGCAGTDEWVAIEVEHDHQWHALCKVLGTDGLEAEPGAGNSGATALERAEQRRAHHDALDAWLAARCGGWDAAELAERLVEAGVPGARVIRPPEVVDNPQIRHRGLFEVEEHPVTGSHRLPGLPFKMSSVERWLRRPAPLLGQHNDEVLAEIGLGADPRESLRQAGIIGETLVAP